MMRSIKTGALAVLMSVSIYANHQIIATTGGSVELAGLPGRERQSRFFPLGELSYHGSQIITESLYLRGKLIVQGIGAAEENESSLYDHRTTPYLFDGYLSSHMTNKDHLLTLLAEGDITPLSKSIAFPVAPLDNSPLIASRLVHRNALGIGTRYGYENEHIRIALDLLYRQSAFDRTWNDSTQFYRESDLFYHGSGAVTFWDQQIYLGGSLFAKDDRNSYRGYNWQRSALEAGTALVLHKRKTQIYSRIAFTDFKGEMIKSKGYTTGMGGDSYLRLSRKLNRSLYLKAHMDITGRSETVKHRFGGSLRRARKGNSLEGGYWITGGSLFPRQCAWGKTAVRLIDNHLELEPSLKNYWIEKNNSYRYYRTDLAMTIHVRPLENSRDLTITTGGLWRTFDEAKQFVSGVELFIGIEAHL